MKYVFSHVVGLVKKISKNEIISEARLNVELFIKKDFYDKLSFFKDKKNLIVNLFYREENLNKLPK